MPPAGEAVRGRERLRQAQQLVHLHAVRRAAAQPGGPDRERSGNPELFPVVMAALVAGVDAYGDLMRLAIASPGNDFRLGAMEAPPSVISTYLGTQMTAYLTEFMERQRVRVQAVPRRPFRSRRGHHASSVINAPAEDRNRTSPFPYGGHRFEFRAVGSSRRTCLMVNTVLDAMAREVVRHYLGPDRGGREAPSTVAQDLLKKHSKVMCTTATDTIRKWPDEGGQAMGVTQDRLRRGGDQQAGGPEERRDVHGAWASSTAEECARVAERFLLEGYVGTVEMEVGCMIDMINQHAIPSAKAAGINTSGLEKGAKEGAAASRRSTRPRTRSSRRSSAACFASRRW